MMKKTVWNLTLCILLALAMLALTACDGPGTEPADLTDPAEDEALVEEPGEEDGTEPSGEEPGEGDMNEENGAPGITDIQVPGDPTEGEGTPGAVGNSSSNPPAPPAPETGGTTAEPGPKDPGDWTMPEESGYGADMTSFATLDLNGNTVTQAIFSDYDYTVVDVWGTYCRPCIVAMPGLAEIYNEYKDKGVNVMGLVIDVQNGNLSPNAAQVQAAWDIINETGANFTHIMVSSNMISPIMNEVQYIPTSFIVDSEGNIVDGFHVGARSAEDWRSVLDGLLAQ